MNPTERHQSNFYQGWVMFKSALLFLFQHPAFLVPLSFAWFVFAGIVLYLRYYWIQPADFLFACGEFFLFIFIISYTMCLANLTMLELIRQIEDDKPISFPAAFARVLSSDSIKVIPLAIFFAFVWFIILLIRAATSKNSRKGKTEPSMKDAAMTLGGMNSNPISWISLGLSMFEKLLRMVVFLALPAIAWENESSFSAFKEALEIVKKHPAQFLTSYALTGAAGIVMALPLIPVVIIAKAHIAVPDTFWLLVILYEGLTWTLGVYLEQMTVALLYLWHLKWKQNGATGDLSAFLKPDLLSDFHQLKNSQV